MKFWRAIEAADRLDHVVVPLSETLSHLQRGRYNLAVIDHHQITQAGLIKINLTHLIHSAHLEKERSGADG